MARKKSDKPTLKDIATQLGLSVAAVSMALSDHAQIGAETKARVRAACQALNYPGSRRRPRGDAAGERLRRLGFLLLGSRLEDESLAPLVHEFAAASARQDVRLELSAIEDVRDQAAVMTHVDACARGVSGMVFCGLVDTPVLDRAAAHRIPCVVLGHFLGESSVAGEVSVWRVCSDEVAMGRMATRRLLEQGHTRIAFVCGRLIPGLFTAGWLDGYRLALFDCGVPADPALVQVTGKAPSGGSHAARDLLRLNPPPTAFVIPNVRVAAAFAGAMRAQGHPVKPACIVASGRPDGLVRFGLDGAPLVAEDHSAMARQVLGLLQNPEALKRGALRLVVPFRLINF